jgi:hypothetical protein
MPSTARILAQPQRMSLHIDLPTPARELIPFSARRYSTSRSRRCSSRRRHLPARTSASSNSSRSSSSLVAVNSSRASLRSIRSPAVIASSTQGIRSTPRLGRRIAENAERFGRARKLTFRRRSGARAAVAYSERGNALAPANKSGEATHRTRQPALQAPQAPARAGVAHSCGRPVEDDLGCGSRARAHTGRRQR